MLSQTTTLLETESKWVSLLREQQSNTSSAILRTVSYRIEERLATSGHAQLSPVSLDTVVENFLASSQKVLLLLGTAGSGKTLCCHTLVQKLCQETQFSSYIPIYISLSKISNCRESFLERLLEIDYQLLPEHIFWLKQQDNVVFILDGFGEQGPLVNLIITQQLMHWQAKVIITCRDQYLTECNDHTLYFTPFTHQRQQHQLLIEYRLAPFNETQIFNYVQHSATTEIHHAIQSDTLLGQLASNPLWLQFLVEELSSNSKEMENNALKNNRDNVIKRVITRWFVWQENKYQVLGLLDKTETIQAECWIYCHALAYYIRQKDCSTIVYQPVSRLFTKNSDDSLSKLFASSTPQLTLLRRACPFQETKPHHFVFMAEEFIDYFADNKSKAQLKEIQSTQFLSNSSSKRSFSIMQSLEKHYLNRKRMTHDVAMMQWLAERVIENKAFEKFLFHFLWLSKNNKVFEIGGANSFTGLNQAYVSFSDMDLSYIQVRKANLRGMVAHNTNFKHANFTGCNLRGAYLANSCFDGADLKQIDFGELPHFSWPTGCVTQVRFSPDDKYLIAAGDNNTVLIFDLETQEEIRNFSAHTRRVLNVDVSPDGKSLVTSSSDKTIRLWDIKTGHSRMIADFNDNDRIRILYHSYFPVIFSVDGRKLICAEEHMLGSYKLRLIPISMHNVLSQSEVLTQGMGHINQIRWGDENLLGFVISHSYGEYTIQIWDIAKRKCLKELNGYWLCFSPDNYQLAIASITEKGKNIIQIYSVPKFELEYSFSAHLGAEHSMIHPGTIRDLQFYPDKNRRILASCGDDKIIFLWDLSDYKPEPIARLSGHNEPITCLAFSQTGGLLVSGTGALSLRGHTTGDRTLRLWDIKSLLYLQETSHAHQGEIYSLAVSVANREVMTAGRDGTIKRWSMDRGQFLGSILAFPEHQELRWREIRTMCLFTPEKSYKKSNEQLFVVSGKSKLKAFQLGTNAAGLKKAIDKQNINYILALAVSADKQRLAVGSLNGHVNIYNLITLQLICTYEAPATRVAFSPDETSYLLAVTGDNLLTVIDSVTGKLIFETPELRTEGGCGLGGVAFSPCDFSLVASIKNTINEQDRAGSVMLWNLKEKHCIFELKGHKDVIDCLCFSPDGKYLLSGDASDEIIIWDVALQVKKTHIKINNQSIGINDIQFFDNQLFFTAHQDGVIRAWRLTLNDNKLTVNLQWHTAGEVILREASFDQVHNLDKRNLLLLKKKGGKLPKEERKQANYYLQLGRSQLQTHKFDLAIETLGQAIKYDPHFTLAYIERGRAKVLSKDFKGGEYDYTFAIDASECEQDEQKARYYRAILYASSGLYDKAMEDLKWAKQIGFLGLSKEEIEFKKNFHMHYARIEEEKRIEDVFHSCQLGAYQFRKIFRHSDIDKKSREGFPVLHYAIQFNQPQIIKELLQAGADPALQDDKNEHTALRFALPDKADDIKLIKMLVDANPKAINVFDKEGFTALHRVVALQKYELAAYFLQRGADPNVRKLGKTMIPLIIAIRNRDARMVQLLLDNGSDYTITTSIMQTTPFSYLLEFATKLSISLKNPWSLDGESIEKITEAKNLLAISVLLRDQYRKDKRIVPPDAIIIKTLKKMLDICDVVPTNQTTTNQKDKVFSVKQKPTLHSNDSLTLFKGIFVDKKSSQSEIILNKMIVKYQLKDASQVMLEKGLRMAANNKNVNDLKFFIKQVNNIDAQDANLQSKKTALHWATIKKSKECISALLDAKARADIPDANHKTAFEYAMELDDMEIINLFNEKLKFTKAI
jgi:WD40 repeat protein/ankyrin repeat protein